MMKIIKGYFNSFPDELGNTIICGLPGGGKTIRVIRVFTCTTDTTDISRLPSQSVSTLANAIRENCQFKIKFKS